MLILNYSWAVWLAWGLAAFLVFNGLLNIVGFKPMRDVLLKWGYPAWFQLVNGVFQAVVGLMIAWYPTRPFGLLFGLLLCFAISAMLIRRRAWAHLPPPTVLAGAILLTAWGLRLI